MSNVTNKITLYDFIRRGDQPNTTKKSCWSYNVWKLRLALNYKNLPYTTVWVDHNTLAPTLQSLGVPPADTSSGGFPYTVPTVKFPDGTVVTESAVIAAELEKRYPDTPPLRLNAELQAEADRAVFAAAIPVFALYMPHAAREVVVESTVEVFKKTREKRFGISLEQMEQRVRENGEDPVWESAAPGFEAVKALLTEHKAKGDDGPFIQGSQPCYADFVLVAEFEALKRVKQELFDKAIVIDESFRRLYDACSQWFENDH